MSQGADATVRLDVDASGADVVVAKLAERIDRLTSVLAKKFLLDLEVDSTQVDRALDSVGKKGGGALQKAFNFNQITQSVSTVANSLNEVISVGAEFESGVAALGAITGQSGESLDRLADSARKLALQFGGSASDQLQSFQGILSKLGPQVADTPEALAKLAENVNTLAAASGDDAATSMNAIVDSMLQFGLVTGDATKDAETSTRVINALAGSAQVGASEIPQVADAILQCGVAAKGANLSFESTNAALQVLAVGGKTGANAGVALRNVLGLLQKASGPAEASLRKMGTSSKELGELLTTKGLDAALEKVKGGMAKLGSDAERNAALMQIFGTENSAAAGILIENTDKFREFHEGIVLAEQGTGAAFEQAAVRMDTTSTRIAKAKAYVEDAMLSIFGVLGKGVNTVIGAASQIAPTVTALAGIKNFVPDGAIEALTGGKGLAGALTTVKGLATSAGSAIMGAGKAMLAFLVSPAGLAIAALAALVTILVLTRKSHADMLNDQLAAGQAQLKNVEVQKKGLQIQIQQNTEMPKLAANYKDLAGKANRTAAEEKLLTDVKLKLNGQYPGLIKSGDSYGKSLAAINLQAGKSKDAIKGLQAQMLELDKQAKIIAANNRKIQAQILQDTIITELFNAQSDWLDKADNFFNGLIGGENSKLEGMRKQMQSFFAELIDSKTEADVARRVGSFSLKLQELFNAKKITGEDYNKILNQVGQLGDLLSAKFKKAADTTSEAVVDGATTVAGEVKEVTSDAERIRMEIMQQALQNRLRLASDETQKMLIEVEGQKKILAKEYQQKKEAYDKEVKAGTRKAVDLKALYDQYHGTNGKIPSLELQIDAERLKRQQATSADLLKGDTDLFNAQTAALKQQAETMLAIDSQSMTQRLALQLQVTRRTNDAVLTEMVRGSKEFAAFIKGKTTDQINGEFDSQLKLAQARASGDEKAIAQAEEAVERAHQVVVDKLRSLQDDFLGGVLSGAVPDTEALRQQIANSIDAATAESTKLFTEGERAIRSAVTRERIAGITDLREQQRQLELLEVDETLSKELEANRGNDRKIEELNRQALAKRKAINLRYRAEDDGLFATSLGFQEEFYKGFLLNIDSARNESLKREIADLTKQYGEIKSLREKDLISYDEYTKRIVELARQKAAKERELDATRFDLLRALNAGAAASFNVLAGRFSDQLTTVVDGFAAGTSTMTDVLEKAAFQFTAIVGAAAVSGQDIAKASANASIDIALKTLLANEAKFLFAIFGTTMEQLGPILGPLAFIGAASTLTALASIAKSALTGAKYATGGLVPGGEQQITINELGEEFVINHRATRKHLPLLRAINRDEDISKYFVNDGGKIVAGGDVARAIDAQTTVLGDRLEKVEKKMDKVAKRFESESKVKVGGSFRIAGGDLTATIEEQQYTDALRG